MKDFPTRSLIPALLASCAAFCALPAQAQKAQSWMSPDVSRAWSEGYKGQGTTITVVDDFSGTGLFWGDLRDGVPAERLRHGEWTRMAASLMAPSATIKSHGFTSGTVPLQKGLNVINLSYSLSAPIEKRSTGVGFGSRDGSVVRYAQAGQAVVVKSASNYSMPIQAGTNAQGSWFDPLAEALRGAPSAIFVGALNKNGSTSSKAELAYYSNRAGSDALIQKQFLVVGVEWDKMGLGGTSMAAPMISGYAAIVGSKFTRATPTQITNQLLLTARQDTLKNYSAAVYGRGEASLSRALAPVSIR